MYEKGHNFVLLSYMEILNHNGNVLYNM